jgi:hypothetical protein
MKHIRPSYLAQLAMLAATVAAGPAYACPPCGPMMAPVSAAPPSVRPPTPPSVGPPNVSGAVNAATGAAGQAAKAGLDQYQRTMNDPKLQKLPPKDRERLAKALADQKIKQAQEQQRKDYWRRTNEANKEKGKKEYDPVLDKLEKKGPKPQDTDGVLIDAVEKRGGTQPYQDVLDVLGRPIKK